MESHRYGSFIKWFGGERKDTDQSTNGLVEQDWFGGMTQTQRTTIDGWDPYRMMDTMISSNGLVELQRLGIIHLMVWRKMVANGQLMVWCQILSVMEFSHTRTLKLVVTFIQE